MKLSDGEVTGLRLGGSQYAYGALLEDDTPIAVMEGRIIAVDNEGWQVEYQSLSYSQHPWETTPCALSDLRVYRRVTKADTRLLSAQQQEFCDLDPIIVLPVQCKDAGVVIQGDLPQKTIKNLGGGIRGIECRLSEVPKNTQIKILYGFHQKSRLIIRHAL